MKNLKIKSLKYSFSISDQIFFVQKLALLIESNISLSESLKIIKEMDNSKKKREIFGSLILDCERGVSLSKSLVNSGAKFDPLLISLVKSSEYSGSIIQALNQIYKNLEKRNELRKRLISTMIYPVFILFATAGMALFLVLYIFPKILPLLGSLNIELPFLTKVVKSIYEISMSYGLYLILLTSILFTVIFFCIKKIILFRNLSHNILLKIPLIKSYIKLHILSSFCSTAEMLLSSGVSISDASDFSQESERNILFKNAFCIIREESIRGVSFTNSISEFPNLFPKIMTEMCSIGERTGNLAVMLGHCARIFEQDIDQFLKRFSSLMEPVLMIIMGLVVGSIALSIILPVYEITNHLSH